MNTPIRARLTAFAASILITFTVVHGIANYARPVDEPAQLAQLALNQAASSSASADQAADRMDDRPLVVAVETR